MNIIFTTCTYNHIGRAFSLASSIKKNCANTKLIIGLVDKGNEVFPNCDSEIISAKEMQLPFLDEMFKKYTALELNSALKPYFADYILRSKEVEQIVFLDSDILLYSDIVEITQEKMMNNSVLLSPHALSSPEEATHLTDRNFLRSGIYNAGFFAVKNDEYGFHFLNWWKDKVKNHCFINAQAGMFAEQLWLNLVPLYHQKVYVIKDLGYNVAYWNLHERTISKSGKNYVVNNVYPLVFFHFSGANVETFKQRKLTVHNTPYTLDNRPDVEELFSEYTTCLESNNFENYDQYYTISKNFKTKSRYISFLSKIYKKTIKHLFYKQ